MDFENLKLPPLEEVLGRVEGEEIGKNSVDKNTSERHDDNETKPIYCPIARQIDGDGEIGVIHGNKRNTVGCDYIAASEFCRKTGSVCDYTLKPGRNYFWLKVRSVLIGDIDPDYDL